MFLKFIASIILAPIILVGKIISITSPEVYIAPKETPEKIVKTEKPVATTTKPVVVVKATTTNVVKKAIETKPVEKPTVATPVIIIPEPTPDFEKINTDSRKTIINIFCTTKNNELSPISGTGVIITGGGLILTNAHIAQYLLLKDFREKDYLKCIGRTGSPAYPKYNLELVYISPNWVSVNKTLLKEQNPKGTGEDDFAFLRITGSIDSSKLPDFLTFIEPNVREIIDKGEPVLLVSYPAGFLGGLSIIKDLNVVSSITTVQDVFTFKEGTIDVLSVGGTIVSQKGSSGGLVVDKNTSLIGIITTSSDGETTSSRGLNAITLSYINKVMEKEIGMNLKNFLFIDHANYAEDFLINKAPILSKIIIDELTKQ